MATVGPGTRLTSAIVPPPDASVPRWHISPAVDGLAYHASWLLILVPLLFFGPDRFRDYVGLYVLVMVLSFSHRHATFPYVYFDRQVFQRHPVRFVVAPALAIAAFVASPLLYGWTVPALTWSGVHVVTLVGALAVLVQLIRQTRVGHAPRLLALAVAAVPLLGAAAADLFWDPGPNAIAGVWLVALLATSGVLAFEGLRAARSGPELAVETTDAAPVAVATPSPSRWWHLAVPALLLILGGLALLPTLQIGLLPTAPFKFKTVIRGAFFAGAVWNVWHVYMQKFGILRMYSAKSGVEPDKRAPHAVDRLLVFSWVPLVVLTLAVTGGEALSANRSAAFWTEMIAAYLAPVAPVLLPLGWGLVAVAVGLFLRAEWRADRWSNPARLMAALSLVGINAMFLFVDPIKVYIAFGFAHAVEYMVFVWAFQRRRYHAPLQHRPLMGWLTRRPLILWGGFAVLVCGSYFFAAHGHRIFGWDKPELFGTSLIRLAFFWTIWQQLLHFWYDGFLWKMRLPTVRASL